MSKFKQWESQYLQWKEIYKVKPVEKSFNPTSITLFKQCAKCKKTKGRLTRHHKGHEYLFACIMPQFYAERYIQFHPDDINWLCSKCHKRIHHLYMPIVNEVSLYVNTTLVVDYHRLEQFRLRIIEYYEKWLSRKPYTKRGVKKSCQPSKRSQR